jgi:hypothetical protein
MIWKSMPSGFDPMGGNRFSEKHALGLDPRDHAAPKIQSAMTNPPKAVALWAPSRAIIA